MDYVLLILENSKFVSVKGRQFAFPMNKTFNNVGMGDYMLQNYFLDLNILIYDMYTVYLIKTEFVSITENITQCCLGKKTQSLTTIMVISFQTDRSGQTA